MSAVEALDPPEEVTAQDLLEEATAQEDPVALVQRSTAMEKDLQLNKDQVAHTGPQEAPAKVQVDGLGEAQVVLQNPVEEAMVAVEDQAEVTH